MNYAAIHDSIISKAKSEERQKAGVVIYELHHIVMRSLGGDDSQENTVLLTPREHFLVHYLLWKMHPSDDRYRHPIFLFKHKGAKNSRLYEAARKEHIIRMKMDNPSLHLSEESKLSKSNKLKNHIRSEEHCRNISIAKMGKPTRTGAVLSRKTRDKIAESVKRWNREIGVSDATREKLRKSNIGRTHSYQSIQLMSRSAKSRKKYKCPHCEKAFDGGNLTLHMKALGFSSEEILAIKLY